MITIIESPYAGDIEANVAYARACIAAVARHSPEPHHVMASHLLYTQPGILDDSKPEERQKGMEMGWALYRAPGAVCVACLDRGVSNGMIAGIRKAVEYRASVVGVTLQRGCLVPVMDWYSSGGTGIQDALQEIRTGLGYLRHYVHMLTISEAHYLKTRSYVESLNA